MDILICHFGNAWEALVVSSLLCGLPREFGEANIYWATSLDNAPLFLYNKKVQKVYLDGEPIDHHFNLTINLTPSMQPAQYVAAVNSDVKLGFIENDGAIISTGQDAETSYRIMAGDQNTDRNMFQVMFRIAGLKWKGEGYDLAYFPKTKTKKRKTGVAIADPELRTFVKDNLSLGLSEIWHIPIKRNLLKRIDEINRCKNIVTDDLFTLHAAIALRKHVEFLDVVGISSAVEFFGNGKYYRLFRDEST